MYRLAHELSRLAHGRRLAHVGHRVALRVKKVAYRLNLAHRVHMGSHG